MMIVIIPIPCIRRLTQTDTRVVNRKDNPKSSFHSNALRSSWDPPLAIAQTAIVGFRLAGLDSSASRSPIRKVWGGMLEA
jgi:hypothetical protein